MIPKYSVFRPTHVTHSESLLGDVGLMIGQTWDGQYIVNTTKTSAPFVGSIIVTLTHMDQAAIHLRSRPLRWADDIQLFVSHPQAAQGLKVDFQWSLAQTHWSIQAFLCFAQPLGRTLCDVLWLWAITLRPSKHLNLNSPELNLDYT